MPRAGRELELLVQRLESFLAESPVEIKSPDNIRGKLTGSNREVDISLRAKVGSVDVLVIIECRDRDGTEDSPWIGELAVKAEDVGAHRAVAVSSSGFSEGARNLARIKEIELRTYNEIDLTTANGWITRIRDLFAFTTSVQLRRIGLANPADRLSGAWSDLPDTPTLTGAKCFIAPNGDRHSLRDIFMQAMVGKLKEIPFADEGAWTGEVTLQPHVPGDWYSIDLPIGIQARVDVIVLNVTITMTERSLEPTRHFEYAHDGQPITRTSEIDIVEDGWPRFVLGVTATDDESRARFTFTPREAFPGKLTVYFEAEIPNSPDHAGESAAHDGPVGA